MFKKLYPILVISLFITLPLRSENQLTAPTSSTEIHDYEQSGDYANALDLARKNNESPTIIASLEKSLLIYGCSRLIFNGDHQPRQKLLQLLEILGMPPLEKTNNSIFQINEWAQKNLLRQGERWEQQAFVFEKLQSKIKPLLCDLGFINTLPSHFNQYQGALVHGALLSRVRLRLHYLIEQWNLGIRFSELYFLSGERPLNPIYENEDLLKQEDPSLLKIKKNWQAPKELPKTEVEMMQLVWEQSDIPEDMRKYVKVYFVNAPMKKDPKSNTLLRPTTDDTIDMWVKSSPSKGRYLAITNAPYINRQDTVTRTIAPSDYEFDTVGPAADTEEHMAIFLDELARLIFQTKQLAIKNNATR